jgi:hypothetical protein
MVILSVWSGPPEGRLLGTVLPTVRWPDTPTVFVEKATAKARYAGFLVGRGCRKQSLLEPFFG